MKAIPVKLLIDVGNTRLKLARLVNDEFTFMAALDTQNPESLAAELKVLVQRIAQDRHTEEPKSQKDKAQKNNPPKNKIQTITNALAVSVHHPETEAAIAAALSGIPIEWVHPSTSAGGVTNAYPNPKQLGADRWVGMIGLTRHFCQPHQSLILANFGTATTVDTLGADRLFRGGLILPGVWMMQRALAQGTARLPETPGTLMDYPTETTAAITTGIAAAQTGALLRQVTVAQSLDKRDPMVCVSGGAWPLVEAEVRRALPNVEIHELPHVVLHGLAVLAALADQDGHENDVSEK